MVFNVWGLGFGVSGFRLEGLRGWGFRFGGLGLKFEVWVLDFVF